MTVFCRAPIRKRLLSPWVIVTTCLCILTSKVLKSPETRFFMWVCHQRITFAAQRDTPRHCAFVCVCILSCLRRAFIPDLLYPYKSTRHPLMITTHHQHSVSPSWSTLFSQIPLKDYSQVPSASPAWLSSASHIDRKKLVYLPIGKKEAKKNNLKTFYPCVKSICLISVANIR